MILRIVKERLWAFKLMRVILKTKRKEIITTNTEKTSLRANEISKLPKANCLGAEIDETCSWLNLPASISISLFFLSEKP